jgi:5-dehydro-4-deoxyglucarate dehydratase
MSTPLTPDALRRHLAEPGLLAFPLTDFAPDGGFAPDRFQARIDWMAAHRPHALVIAGGAGEYFSLDRDEREAVLARSLDARPAALPVIASAGGGTRDAVDAARTAERLGADGLLLLPPYLAEPSQAGLEAHLAAVCASTSLGVVVYGRANCRPRAETLARLCDRFPNLVGYKDGLGEFEELWAIRMRLAGRLVVLNGMPTAEVYASAYRGMGIPSYSSAVFAFLPEYAMAFFDAVTAGRLADVERMMGEFFVPYGRLRARQPGYAVAIPKAGAALVGRDAGPVRPPLSDPTPEELDALAALIAKVSGVRRGAAGAATLH